MTSPRLLQASKSTRTEREVRKSRRSATPSLPASHLEAMQAAGFEALTWHNRAIDVRASDGSVRREWLPRELVNWTTRQAIQWREASDGNYDFSGWEPISGHSHGGRYASLHSALGWFEWLANQNGEDY